MLELAFVDLHEQLFHKRVLRISERCRALVCKLLPSLINLCADLRTFLFCWSLLALHSFSFRNENFLLALRSFLCEEVTLLFLLLVTKLVDP